MLTQINDLRRARRSIFFVATNRLRAFDSAVTRPGRFDLQLFVGTPNLDARVSRFRSRLSGLGLDEDRATEATEAFRNFLAARWDRDAMFLNFLESEQFASAALSLVAADQDLDEAVLDPLFESQAAVMVVRGPVREEYQMSMGLSRV